MTRPRRRPPRPDRLRAGARRGTERHRCRDRGRGWSAQRHQGHALALGPPRRGGRGAVLGQRSGRRASDPPHLAALDQPGHVLGPAQLRRLGHHRRRRGTDAFGQRGVRPLPPRERQNEGADEAVARPHLRDHLDRGAAACRRSPASASTEPSAPRATITCRATPAATRPWAKSAVSSRVSSRRPASASASSPSIRRIRRPGIGWSTASCSALPDVSSTRPSAHRRRQLRGKSSGNPRRLAARNHREGPRLARARKSWNTRARSAGPQAGPGSMKRYCRPVSSSVTVRLCRVSPGPVIPRKVIPASRNSSASRSPVSRPAPQAPAPRRPAHGSRGPR